VRVECLAQEDNAVSPARARTRAAQSRVERTNHEATAPPTGLIESVQIISNLLSYIASGRVVFKCILWDLIFEYNFLQAGKYFHKYHGMKPAKQTYS